MAYLKDATVMLHNNELYSADQEETNSERVKINNCTDVEFNVGAGASVNNYEGNSISVGKGITAVSDISDVKLVASGRSGDWFYRKYSDGYAECWTRLESTTTNPVKNVTLPFTFVSSVSPHEMGNIQITSETIPIGYSLVTEGHYFDSDMNIETGMYFAKSFTLNRTYVDSEGYASTDSLVLSIRVCGFWK